MKDHFNRASGYKGYSGHYSRKSDLWKYEKNNNHLYEQTWTFSVKSNVRKYKGFDDVIFTITTERFDPPAAAPPDHSARATEIVNRAFAEVLAEKTAPQKPSFLGRWLGRTP